MKMKIKISQKYIDWLLNYFNLKKYFWGYLNKKINTIIIFLIFKNSFIYFKNFNYIEFQNFLLYLENKIQNHRFKM